MYLDLIFKFGHSNDQCVLRGKVEEENYMVIFHKINPFSNILH